MRRGDMAGRVEDMVRVKNVITRVARAIQEYYPEVADRFREGKSYRGIATEYLPLDTDRFSMLGSSVKSILMSGARLALCGSDEVNGLMPQEEFRACASRNHSVGRDRGAKSSYAQGKGFFSDDGKRAAAKGRGQRTWEDSEESKAVDLYLQNFSFAQIGRELDRSRDGVVNYFRKNAGKILASKLLYLAQYDKSIAETLKSYG